MWTFRVLPLSYKYDATDKNERTYTWSYDDRLLYINYPDSTKSSMRYGYMGLRTYRKDNAGDITNYYWSLLGLPQVINETDSSGNAKASDIIGASLIAIKVSGTKKYYITDALGSVLALADSSGNVTDTYDYGPFGELVASTGTSYNPYRFTGQQWDEDSGLYYLRARYYEPIIGNFLNRDPVNSLNRYNYVSGNPVNYIDAWGLEKCCTTTFGECVNKCMTHMLINPTKWFYGLVLSGLANAVIRTPVGKITFGSMAGGWLGSIYGYISTGAITETELLIFAEQGALIAAVAMEYFGAAVCLAASYVAGATIGCLSVCYGDPCSWDI